MKKIFISTISSLLVMYGWSQPRLTENSTPGTWEATSVEIPGLFSYDKGSGKFQLSKEVDKAVKEDSKGSLTKPLSDLKSDIAAKIASAYIEFKSDKTMKLIIDGKAEVGTYNLFSKGPAPSFNSDEEIFLQYTYNFGYDGGIVLSPNYRRQKFYANVSVENGAIILKLQYQPVMIFGTPAICIYKFKKLAAADAASIKNKEKKAADDLANLLKQKDKDKEISDEKKDGKLYTTADVVPFCSNESVAIQQISEYLMQLGQEYNIAPGAGTITAEFTINKDGSMTDFSIRGTDTESYIKSAFAYIKRKLIYTPAEVAGEKVRFRMSKAFRFMISEQ